MTPTTTCVYNEGKIKSKNDDSNSQNNSVNSHTHKAELDPAVLRTSVSPANEGLSKAFRLCLDGGVSRRLIHEAVRLIRHGCWRVQVREAN